MIQNQAKEDCLWVLQIAELLSFAMGMGNRENFLGITMGMGNEENFQGSPWGYWD